MTDEKRFVYEEKRYAILTKDSVRMMSEAAGHTDITDPTLVLLGEDVSYRLREMTQKSAQFMRHAKRRRLTADDFSKACKQSDVQPVHGYRSLEPPPAFRQTRDGEIYFEEDPEVNLADTAANMTVPKNMGQPTIKAHWLAIEGIQKTSTASQNPQGKPVSGKHEVSDTLLKYYDKVTQAILGFDEEMMKTALLDLKTNSRIMPLLPHFVNFVSSGVKTVSHDVRQLTKLLYTVTALAGNPMLFLEPQPYLVMLVQGVTYCLLEPLAASINPNNDHWSLRDYAAQLLASIVSIWGNSVNHLERFTEKALREVLHDHSRPFCCHYGAVMGLQALGVQSVERVLLPQLSVYRPHLTTAMQEVNPDSALTKADAFKTHGAILLSVELVFREKLRTFEAEKDIGDGSLDRLDTANTQATAVMNQKERRKVSNSGFVSQFDKTPLNFYNEMYELFGDSLSMRLPVMPELKEKIFKPLGKETVLSLSDRETQKSGEQLLEELLVQVKQQEALDKQRREQKLVAKEKRQREAQRREERHRLGSNWQQVEEKKRQLLQQPAAPVKLRQSKSCHSDEDEEVDVEGDVKSDPSENSEKSEEEFSSQGAADVALAVKSTVSGPGQGIKLTITKRPRLKLNIKPVEPPQQKDMKDTRQAYKRKHSLRSPKEIDYCEQDEEDDFEGEEQGSGSAPSYMTHTYYSSEGEGSSDGSSLRKPLTLKIKKKEAQD